MSAKRKICVVTGSRAEYGLLKELMLEIKADSDLELQVIAAAMHLAPQFGLTYKNIEADGFIIDSRVECISDDDSEYGVAVATAKAMHGFAEAYNRLKPDMVVVLGDRFEILAASSVAALMRIPLAHIHGGEITEGAFDDAIRHAITKMAQWHFVAAEPYRKRVIQMGEQSEHVFNFGAPGLDAISRTEFLNREQLAESLGIKLGKPLFLVTYHPETLADRKPEDSVAEMLAALDKFQSATIIFTYPNADAGGRAIIARIEEFVDHNQGRAKAFTSLGGQRYLSLMREADLLIGNSSSALLEAPAFKKAAVNIGGRQDGRLKAASIIDSAEGAVAIETAIKKALLPQFQASLADVKSLYGSGDTARRIKEVIKSCGLEVRKKFNDVDYR